MKRERGSTLSLLGLGGAACVACCAGPILAFLAGLGAAGLASTVLIGAGGLLIAGTAVTAFFVLRRRTACAVPDPHPVPVSAPTRGTPVP